MNALFFKPKNKDNTKSFSSQQSPSVSLEKMKVTTGLLYLASSFVSVYATDNGIFDAVDGASGTIVNRVVTTFNTSIFPIACVILFVCIALAGTNDKWLSALKQWLKWLFYVFIGINCINIISNTVMWIVGLLNGSGSTSIIG